jgi:hypothetical protein
MSTRLILFCHFAKTLQYLRRKHLAELRGFITVAFLFIDQVLCFFAIVGVSFIIKAEAAHCLQGT